jgi:lipoyl(octanoyl) transferase
MGSHGSDRRCIRWSWLGQVPYAAGVALQETVRERVKRGEGDEHLLLLEHPPVYTLGRNASSVDVTAPAEWLALEGIETHASDRGGQVTYHGPGQLVGYPVLDLSPDRKDVRRYVDDLQEVMIRTLARFGVAARRKVGRENIGVWVDVPGTLAGEGKIASIGVHLSRWVTTHGFALNVTTDLDHFRGIVACGLRGVTMASMESVAGVRPPLPDVARVAAEMAGEVYGRCMVEVPADEVLALVADAPVGATP